MRTLMAVVALSAALVMGAFLGVAYAQNEAAPAAYVIAAGRIIDPDGLQAYAEAARPVALAAGLELLARADGDGLHLVEGDRVARRQGRTRLRHRP